VLETAGACIMMLFTTEYSIKAFVVGKPVVNSIVTTAMANKRLAIPAELALLCVDKETPDPPLIIR
jgi:hypothetical protein